MKKEFKVFVVELFKGFEVVEILFANNLNEFKGDKLTREDYEGWDDEADSIEFDYDFVIVDEDDNCMLYFIKEKEM